jgi:hypothetical protein
MSHFDSKRCNLLIQHAEGFCHITAEPPNVFCSLEIRVFIMSQNRTTSGSAYFNICNEDRYVDASLRRYPSLCSLEVASKTFYSEVGGSNRDFFFFSSRAKAGNFYYFFFIHLSVLLYWYETCYCLTCTCKQIIHPCY